MASRVKGAEGGGTSRGGLRPFDPHAAPRSDDADAFIRDRGEGPMRSSDDLAETLGEGFIESATTGGDVGDDTLLDAVVPEEIGGPFIESDGSREFANDVDEANPVGAEREPLPRAVAGLVASPLEALLERRSDRARSNQDGEEDDDKDD